MLMIREFEESLEPLTTSGNQIPGSVHQASGQEAVAVGTVRALDPADIVASPHRPHHHALAKGMTPRVVMAELWGRTTGCAGGRGGTMHLNDFSLGYFGSNGIVGAALGIAMGAALAAKLRKTGQVVRRVLRRRRREYRTDVGVRQLRRAPEAPADRRLREQPVRRRDLHRAFRRAGRLDRASVRRASACRRSRSTARTSAPSTGPRGGARARVQRRGADVHRGGHLPVPRPQHRRGRELPRGRTRSRSGGARRIRSSGCGAPSSRAGRLEHRALRRARGRARGDVVEDAIALRGRVATARPGDGDREGHRTPVRRERAGIAMSENVTVGQAFQQGMREEMARDETIFVIGTDLFIRGGHFAQVKGIGPEFGRDRVIDAPISEAAMVAAGVGAAMNGMRPVVDLNFMDFAFGAMDEIVNQAAKARYLWGKPVPLVIRASSGIALYAAQHNNSLEAWFMHTPGLVVVMPSNARGHQGDPQVRAARRGSGHLLHAQAADRYPRGDRRPGRPRPDRKAAIVRPGRHVDADLCRDRRPEGAQGRRGACGRRHRGRGHRSANDLPARLRPGRRVGAQDRPGRWS